MIANGGSGCVQASAAGRSGLEPRTQQLTANSTQNKVEYEWSAHAKLQAG